MAEITLTGEESFLIIAMASGLRTNWYSLSSWVSSTVMRGIALYADVFKLQNAEK
jgi:hypothetical protein